MEIINKKVNDNPLMQRTEVEIIFRIEGPMPSRTQFRDEIVKNFNWEKERVIIKKISTRFGDYNIKVNAFLYSSDDAMKRYETVRKKKDKEVEKQKEVKEENKKEITKEENKEKEEKDKEDKELNEDKGGKSNEVKEESKQEKNEEEVKEEVTQDNDLKENKGDKEENKVNG